MSIKEQIEAIMDTGEVNMFDAKGVRAAAWVAGYKELFEFVGARRDDYFSFIMRGDESFLEI